MLYYWLKCRKNTESKNPKVVRTKNRRIILLLNCVVWNSKESKFLKEQEEKKILILGDIPLVKTLFKKYKMNSIVDRFLLAGDKVMPEMHLRQAGFAYSVCGPFTKNKEWITK